jgi:hypothetical protein
MNDNHIADERKPVAYEVHWPNGEHELIYASALRMISDLGDFTLTELYAAPIAPRADAALEGSEQYRVQMAGISSAALGYWKEGDSIAPEFDTPALRDVAKLYAKYEALRADAEKDAALTNEQLDAAVSAWFEWAELHEFRARMRAAILAAKEKKS